MVKLSNLDISTLTYMLEKEIQACEKITDENTKKLISEHENHIETIRDKLLAMREENIKAYEKY